MSALRRCLLGAAFMTQVSSGRQLWPTDPVPCRTDLAIVAQRHFNKTGVAAEVGVYRGEFAVNNLQHWQGRYYMVDAWQFRPGELHYSDKNYPDDRENRINMHATWLHTRHAGRRARLVKGLSVTVAKRFKDETFDWVYIDAMHTYEAVMQDLRAWYPKVRRGGLVSGDDWADNQVTALMTPQRQSASNGWDAHEAMNWGVVRAVTEFAREKGHELFVTYFGDCYHYPAWYFVKD